MLFRRFWLFGMLFGFLSPLGAATLKQGRVSVEVEAGRGGRIVGWRWDSRDHLVHRFWGMGVVRLAVGSWEGQWGRLDDTPYTLSASPDHAVLKAADAGRGFEIEKTFRLLSERKIKVSVQIRNIGPDRKTVQVGVAHYLNSGFPRPYRPMVLYAPVLPGKSADPVITSLQNKAIFYPVSSLRQPRVEAYNPMNRLTLRLEASEASDLVTQSVGASYLAHDTFLMMESVYPASEWKSGEVKVFKEILSVLDGPQSDPVRQAAIRPQPSVNWKKLPRRCEPKITGTFVQFSGTDRLWNDPQAAFLQLERMRSLGMDTLVLDTVAGAEWAFYPSRLYRVWSPKADPIGTIFDYADRHGMRVFLATGYLDSGWDNLEGEAAEKLLEKHRQVMAELSALYSRRPAFAGWYLAYETVDVQFDNEERSRKIIQLLRGISDEAHRLAPGKPVAAAPYFTMTPSSQEMEALWSRLLGEIRIDILAMQDTVGAATGELRLDYLPPYYAALRRACERAGSVFWTDMEVFRRIQGWPGDSHVTDFDAAEFDRIRRQMDVESRFVDKIICFEFNFHLSPASPSPRLRRKAAAGYEAYRRYVERLESGRVK
ncbi:MAG: DUF4434 domain-containing protein [Armatimonadetes bacterium]|nr:DUF4434 domain-containing protein [Armatimonadota bacterium]